MNPQSSGEMVAETQPEAPRRRKPNVNIGLPRNATAEQRFEHSHTKEPNGCWLWRGALAGNGYAEFRPNGVRHAAHRWAYEHFIGPIPEGLELDHYVCDTPSCVNPNHLRPVTHRENMLRSNRSVAALNLSKRACKRGHPYPDEWIGYRKCKECIRKSARERAWARGVKPRRVRVKRTPRPVRVRPVVNPPTLLGLRGGLAALLASREAS